MKSACVQNLYGKKFAKEAGLWFNEVGSLHLAYNNFGIKKVINEFVEANKSTRPVKFLSKDETLQYSQAVNQTNLLGALYCEDDMIVEARVAIEKLPALSQRKTWC